jgi:long-chain acyl-CoA synthetase
LSAGDYIAVIGRNRPALYWSMVAAQKVGRDSGAALPGRGRRRDGLCAGALRRAFVIAGDQEQVDKVIEVQESVHQIEHIIYQDPRGLQEIRPHEAARAGRCAGRGARRP